MVWIVLLALGVGVRNWEGSGREGGWEQSALSTLELMEEVSYRGIYWVLSLEYVCQIEETKKNSFGLFSSAQKAIFSAFITVLPRNIIIVFVPTCNLSLSYKLT